MFWRCFWGPGFDSMVAMGHFEHGGVRWREPASNYRPPSAQSL